jgi:hypothetical protein
MSYSLQKINFYAWCQIQLFQFYPFKYSFINITENSDEEMPLSVDGVEGLSFREEGKMMIIYFMCSLWCTL